MKEIGGYFGLDILINNPYHKNMIELNTGRNALTYIIQAKKIKKIYIPYFLCDSVTHMLDKQFFDYDYYNIDEYFMPVFEQGLKTNEYLYIVNYYGQISNEIILQLKEKYRNIIIDNTQAFFQKPVSKVDTIYTCRKFFGVPDGSYLSTDSILEKDLEIDISKARMEHILGRFEGQASDYYKNFQMNDELFKELPLKRMSHLTKNILGAIDYEKTRVIRNDNFNYLHNKLSYINILDVKCTDGAFAYPFYVKNGIEIRKELAEKKIYIPTLWPNVLKCNNESSIEYDYTANILPLPCDQRYTVEDMEYIVSSINKIIGGRL
jgi:hypothetical protein